MLFDVNMHSSKRLHKNDANDTRPYCIIINNESTRVFSWVTTENALCEYICKSAPFKLAMAPSRLRSKINGKAIIRQRKADGYERLKLSKKKLYVYIASNESECRQICDAILDACDIDKNIYKIVLDTVMG
jgi:hypothetical protein